MPFLDFVLPGIIASEKHGDPGVWDGDCTTAHPAPRFLGTPPV